MRHDPAEVETELAHGESAFLDCSFWLADAHMLTGREDEARRLLDRLLALRNEVGLLSEECLVGNVPQAFSHNALINTAQNFRDRIRPPSSAAETQPGTNITPEEQSQSARFAEGSLFRTAPFQQGETS